MPVFRELDELVLRAKEGAVTVSEIEAVASALSSRGNVADTYRMVYILGRMGCYQYEDLLARFLNFPSEPQVAGLVISILCSQWGLAAKYRDELLQALRSHPWDVDNEVRLVAISASGKYLVSNSDCDVLVRLIEIAESDDYSHMRRFALEALSRSLGAGYSEAVMPSDQVAKATWSREIMDQARSSMLKDCVK